MQTILDINHANTLDNNNILTTCHDLYIFSQTHDRVVCPVHGEYICKTEEFNA